MKELYPGDQGIWVQYLQLALQRAGQQVMLDGILDQRPVQPWKSNGQQRKVCGKRSTVEPSTALFTWVYHTRGKSRRYLFSIAKMYDTTMERVMHANPGTDAGALQIGSTVVVPLIFRWFPEKSHTLPCLPGGSLRACRHVIPICRWERSEEVLWEHPCGRCSWEMVR